MHWIHCMVPSPQHLPPCHFTVNISLLKVPGLSCFMLYMWLLFICCVVFVVDVLLSPVGRMAPKTSFHLLLVLSKVHLLVTWQRTNGTLCWLAVIWHHNVFSCYVFLLSQSLDCCLLLFGFNVWLLLLSSWCRREIPTNTLVMLTKSTVECAYWIETSNCVKTKAQRSLRTPSGFEKRPARRTHSYGQKLSACTPKWNACNLDTNFLWQQFRSPVSYAISFT